MTLKEFINRFEALLNINFEKIYPNNLPVLSLSNNYSYFLILKHNKKNFLIPFLINDNYLIIDGIKRTFVKRLVIDFEQVFRFLLEENVFEDLNDQLRKKIIMFILKNKFEIDGFEREKLSEIRNKLEEIKRKIDLRDLHFYKLENDDYYSFLFNFLQKEYNKAKEKNLDAEGFLKKLPCEFAIKLIYKRLDLFPIVDLTNPLSDIEDQRKIVFIGNEFTAREKRDIHSSHKFKLCPIETPESEKIGLILHLAKGAYIDGNKILHKNESPDSIFSYATLQIPYIQHNDPSRALMSSKNLKQALPLIEQEEPIIKTGYEKEIVSLDNNSFYIRSEYDGVITDILDDKVIVSNEKNKYEIDLGIYLFPNTKVARKYNPVVSKGQNIKKGDIVAELAGIKNQQLCLGKNLVVFYMSYFGYNIDDAIVISKSASVKLSHYHIEEFEFCFNKSYKILCERNFRIDKENIPILNIDNTNINSTKEMVNGTVVNIKIDGEEKKIHLYLSYIKPAVIGDKLMGRYGNKGVISLILDDEKMPYTVIDGKVVRADIILNPHGIISRMNLGQLLETHWSWVAINHPDEEIRKKAVWSGQPFKETDFEQLSRYLKDTGLDENGQIKVKIPPLRNKNEELETDNPITIGYQYIVKLNHLAENKIHCRADDGPYSLITGIPLKGKSLKGGQRFGEMETWAFIAQDGVSNLIKLFSLLGSKEKGSNQPLKALYTYLIGAGYILEFLDEKENIIKIDEINIKNPVYLRVRKINNKYLEYLEAKKVEKEEDIWEDIKKTNVDIDAFKYIESKDNTYIPLIPIRYRPFELSDINKLYFQIFEKKTIEFRELEKKFRNKINRKKGLIRSAFLGRRLDFSGRAVIIPNPQLDIDTINVPLLFKKKWNLNQNDVVCLNRQPTLHIHNLQSFKVGFTTNNVIEINPLICAGFGADFDGDTMAVYHIPDKYRSYFSDFKWDSFFVENHIFMMANGNLNLNFSQDIVSGLFYKLVFDEDENLNYEGHLKNLIQRLKKEKAITAKIINSIVRDYLLEEKIEPKEALNILKEIAIVGLNSCTKSGISFSVFDLLKIKEELVREEKLSEVLKKFLDKKVFNGPTIMVNSGARGNEKQLTQIVSKRGEVKTISDEYDIFIDKSYIDMLGPDEYFKCSHGARSGLGDKKLLTPECGYLTRQLVFIVSDLLIIEEDCGTKEGFDIKQEFAIDEFLGRFLLNYKDYQLDIPILTIENLKKLAGKQIDNLIIRSPLKCNSLQKGGICAHCYGLLLNTMTPPKIGMNVGIISAQSIGERATQDAMKTFHTGTQTDVVSGLRDIKELFTKPQKSEIIKNAFEEHKDISDLRWFWAKKLYDLYDKKVSLIHYEVMSIRVISNDLHRGGVRSIENKDFFTKMAFSKPFSRLKVLCDKNEVKIGDSIYKKMIIG